MVKRFKHRFGTMWLLFRAVKSTKNTGPDKYAFCDYGIGIDALSYFLLLFGDWGKNVVIFGVGNSTCWK